MQRNNSPEKKQSLDNTSSTSQILVGMNKGFVLTQNEQKQIDCQRIHPDAKPNDFFPNGKLLPQEQINLLKEKWQKKKEIRVIQKKYLASIELTLTAAVC